MHATSRPRRHVLISALAVVGAALSKAALAQAQELKGNQGSSARWGSGWLDLAPPLNFERGEKLQIHVGGTAKRVVLRLLPSGGRAEDDVGVLGAPLDVPESRVLEVKMTETRTQIVQISIHGGPNPWGNYPLGPGNGPATIVSVKRVK